MKPKGLFLDYNGTIIPGYHEIGLAYALLGHAIKTGNVQRAHELFTHHQPACWKMALSGQFDRLGPYFNEHVLVGEEYSLLLVTPIAVDQSKP